MTAANPNLPDPRFIESPSIQNCFRDKDTALPLSSGVTYWYRDIERTSPNKTLKPIYTKVQLADNSYNFVELPNPLTLNAIGTYSDDTGNDINIYLYPYLGTPEDAQAGAEDLYFVEVYSSGGVLQETREAWPPLASGGESPTELFEASDNLLSNPQFVSVLFNPITSYTYSVSGTTTSNVAKDWDVETTGTGSFTVSQDNLTDLLIPTNPPFALTITNTGVTSIKLVQRLSQSPRVVGDAYVSASMVVRSLDSAAHELSMDYVADDGYTANLILASTTADNNYSTLINTESTKITTTNATGGLTGYVDIKITIPPGAQIAVTSTQVAAVQNASSSVQYLEETTARQIDHLYHYDKPNIDFKPIPSMLVGWDFPLNPAQISSSTTLGATNKYVWDQLIMGRAAADFTITRSAVTGHLNAASTAATSSFYCMQYLSGADAQKILGTKLSVNLFTWAVTNTDVTATIYLYRGSSAALFPPLGTTIGTIDAAGAFTLTAANWTEIPRNNLGVATHAVAAVATNPDVNNTENDIGFSGWEITDTTQISNTDKFAIVVAYAVPTSGTTVSIGSISLVPGNIPTRPAPQAADEVFRECQRYYEKSYSIGIPVASAVSAGMVGSANGITGTGTSTIKAQKSFFHIPFNTTKRLVAPTVTLYSVLGTAANVTATIYGKDSIAVTKSSVVDAPISSNWTQIALGRDGVSYFPTLATLDTIIATITSGGGVYNNAAAWVECHYQVEARLGVV